MEKLLLTVDEAVDVLSLSRSKLYELMTEESDDCLPSIKVGTSRRIPAKALKEWVQRRAEEQRPDVSNIVPLRRKRA